MKAQRYYATCACGCGASLAHLRADAIFAGDACRKRFHRAHDPARPDKARTSRSHGELGGRIYLTRADLHELLELCQSASPRLYQKTVDAIERVEAKR